MRSKVVFLLALLMGMISTVLFYQYIQEVGNAEEVLVEEEMAEVIVAFDRISENQIITPEMLELVEVPKKNLHANSITSMDEAVGKFSITIIEKGEVILTHRVKSEEDEKRVISRKVQEGYRAVSVGTDFVRSVSNLIEPEDKVDIVLTEEVEEELESKIILSNVRVLAVGRKMNPSSSEEEGYVEYNSVTVELKQSEATMLVNASEKGSIHFILHTSINQSE